LEFIARFFVVFKYSFKIPGTSVFDYVEKIVYRVGLLSVDWDVKLHLVTCWC